MSIPSIQTIKPVESIISMKKLFLAAGLAAAALVLVKLAVVHSTMDTAFVKPEASGQQTAANTGNVAMATFAGGCFWCIESTFEKLEGVSSAVSGYSGGSTETPPMTMWVAGEPAIRKPSRYITTPK